MAVNGQIQQVQKYAKYAMHEYKYVLSLYSYLQGQMDMQKLCQDWAIMQLPEKYRPVFFERCVVLADNGEEVVQMKRITNE